MRTAEQQLVRRILKGDEAAFSELVEAYQHLVYSTALSISQNRDDAMDISQEVFLRIYRRLDSFRFESALSTWIYRICVTAALDFCRARNRHSTVSLTSAEEGNGWDVPDEDFAPDRVLERLLTAEDIRQGMARLEEEYRVVFTLRDVQGLSYDQIAAVTGLEPGTVKSRISRARKKMRLFLLKQGTCRGQGPSNEAGKGEGE